VEPIKLPNLVDFMRRCELYGVSDGEARQRFRDFLAERKAPDVVMFPGKERSLSNVPISVPQFFLGRGDALQAVDAALRRYDGRVAITAAHGLRGVGKSTLAAAYAERHLAKYRAIWWIRAQMPDSMRADLASLGVRLKWVPADEKEEPAYQHVMERLRHEGDGLLLIYDNAIDGDALIPFLPKGGAARVLVTSNAPAWRGLAEPIELKLWPKAIGADYLIARTGRAADRADAEALSEALGGLPLAHEQAAAYCERLHVSFADYARRLEATPIKLLDAEKDAPLEYHDKLTVAKTFALAIAEADKLHPAAEPLIVRAALLAPEPIPLFLFEDGREALGEPLASALAGDGLEEALAALEAFALVDREEVRDERAPEIATKCFRLHRLVRTVAAARCDAKEPALAALLGAMQHAFDAAGPSADARSWPRARRLAGLAAPLLNAELQADRSRLVQAWVADALARYREFALADYRGARPLFERALTIYEKALGPEHPNTAMILNNVGLLLVTQRDLAGARLLYARALAIYEKALGAEHPDTATSLNNLAMLLQNQGDLAGARPLYERALAILEKALGSEHPNTASSLSNLSSLLQAQGDLAGARPLFERALAIRERALGPDHPDTAINLWWLGVLAERQGDPAAARPLLERAHAIFTKSLGPDHPHTQRVAAHLARLPPPEPPPP
jgi:Tfp pilus assembly protein PilF